MNYVKIIDEQDRKRFETELEKNTLWKNELSAQTKSLLPYNLYYEIFSFDYFIIYNKTNDEYNLYPQNGECELIFIAYDYEMQRLIILDDYKTNYQIL